MKRYKATYLVEVLALELRDQALQAGVISLDANGLEERLDVGGGGAGVATNGKEKVSCEVLHFDVVVVSAADTISLDSRNISSKRQVVVAKVCDFRDSLTCFALGHRLRGTGVDSQERC